MTPVTLSDRLKKANWLLLFVALLLTGIGIATISTATEGRTVNWGWQQTQWAFVAAAATLLVLMVPYRRFMEAAYVFYALALVGLVLVLFKGSGKSASRWIEIGAFRMQPSEFAKLAVVITLAGYLRYQNSHKRLTGLALPFALTLVPVALVMKQPDLGTALLLVPVLFVLLYVAGANVRHLTLVATAGIVAGLLLYLVPGLMQPYQKRRVDAFLTLGRETKADALLRKDQDHQLVQGRIAVGSGGWFGAPEDEGGVSEAIAFLPERHSDFIFPVFAATWGLLGVTGLFLLYFLFLASLLWTAVGVREPSGRLLIVGVFTLFAVQVVVNLAMTVGLLPVVGVPLPFLSYGGSSLLASFLALGLALNAGIDPPPEFGREEGEA